MSNSGWAIIGLIFLFIIGGLVAIIYIAYITYRKNAREQKNYERGLKMVPIMIHLPPTSEDVKSDNRDERDVVDENISQAQTMYNVIASTVTKGFKSRIYGQRHMSFEIVANGGLIHYYAVVPVVLLDNVRQAILAAYPTARLEEVEEINLFSRAGKISGTLGGELTLTKPYSFPIATYKESKRDAMGAILNAMSAAKRGDGIGIQVLLRPAPDGWTKKVEDRADNIREGKKGAASGKRAGVDWSYYAQILEALWKPPTGDGNGKDGKDKKPLSGIDQAKVEAMEEKARYAGYEVLIRLVVSTPNSARSQTLLARLISAFALFNSQTGNGFKFTPARSIEDFVTSYIMRFFPQEIRSNILNVVELATIYHLPDQTNIPSSQVERQTFKEVDGPPQQMDKGLLLGYNIFRGVKKPIRLGDNDRRRHMYVMGATGMGKSVFLENLALQDMVSGKGFAFVDPHGDSAERLLEMVPKERVEDVIYFDPADMDNPIGMNLFEIEPNDPDPERTKDYIISETMNMLYSLYDPQRQGIVGPRMANIVRNAALLLMADPAGGTFMDIPKVLVDPDFAKPKIKYLTNQRAIDFWTKEWPNAQRSNDAGEVTSWVVSKWADFENTMMTNILGQVHSSLNIREVMDNHKILLVNLSKGKLGDMPAKLLGMVFVMKFQAAAMSRANIPEEQRQDFCLFVDEFQNFATDSFESILSEARKYRLNLIVANQFISQLTDKIRGAIMGNTGSYVIGRVGIEDAENVVKIFEPVFDAEDLKYMPNYTAAVKMLINGTPTSPFSMRLPAPMGFPSKELGDALHKLSAAKYGRPRAEVEAEIRQRQGGAKSGPAKPKAKLKTTTPKKSGDSFLDNWLAKRQSMVSNGTISDTKPTDNKSDKGMNTQPKTQNPMSHNNQAAVAPSMTSMPTPPPTPAPPVPPAFYPPGAYGVPAYPQPPSPGRPSQNQPQSQLRNQSQPRAQQTGRMMQSPVTAAAGAVPDNYQTYYSYNQAYRNYPAGYQYGGQPAARQAYYQSNQVQSVQPAQARPTQLVQPVQLQQQTPGQLPLGQYQYQTAGFAGAPSQPVRQAYAVSGVENQYSGAAPSQGPPNQYASPANPSASAGKTVMNNYSVQNRQ